MKPTAPQKVLVTEQGETRGSVRVGIDAPVELHVAGLPAPLPGRCRDVSVGGVCVATPSVFVLKDLRRIVIGLASGPVRLDAEGRWQFDASADDLVLSGLAFVNPSPDAVEAISRLVLDTGRSLAHFLYSKGELRDLELDEVVGVAQVTRLRDVSAGRYIYRQETAERGEDSIFIVESGSVRLQIRTGSGRDLAIARLEPGQLFGGMPLVCDAPHAETAVADGNVRLLEIHRDVFRYLSRARPWLAHRLSSTVTRVNARRLHQVLARLRSEL
ncbi:hypothetical protein MYXO_02643 [Myxococcaceae bacterium]|jgi:CRP-like cAMP-binding protein|nr:hypothetical protein MYXO_02643 [Myxococcaceae bacterium]